MAFLLSRGGDNVIAEVQRWQYFLLKQGIPQVGSIDGDFGSGTEEATKFFQVRSGVTASGRLDEATLDQAVPLGYTVVPDDYYATRGGADFPAEPAGLGSPSNASRNQVFECFRFIQKPLPQRPDEEAIVIRGTCDGGHNDWSAKNIVRIEVPQLKFARGFSGSMRVHRRAAGLVTQLFRAWEQADLLHLIMAYEGAFVPRYKRGQAPEDEGGHGERSSSDVSALSNHSFGSAFDINFRDNQLGRRPALCGRRGSTRELVAAANALGIYWGGHFGNPDGMHFEVARVT